MMDHYGLRIDYGENNASAMSYNTALDAEW